MSLFREQKLNVCNIDVLSVQQPARGSSDDGKYAALSVWPRFRGPSNANVAVSSVTGPTLGAGFTTGSDGAVDYSGTCPVFDNSGNVFVITAAGVLKKMNAAGVVQYTYTVPGTPATTYSQLVVAPGGVVFFAAANGGVYKVADTGSALTGAQIASLGFTSTGSLPLLTGEGNLIVGTNTGLYCLTPAGVVVWANTGILGDATHAADGWNLALNFNTNTLYLGTATNFYTISAVDGSVVHKEVVGVSMEWSAPVVGPQYVYVGSQLGLIAFNYDGTVAWINREVGNCYDASPAYSASLNRVYIGSELFALSGVDGTTGASIFKANAPTVAGTSNEYSSCIVDAAGSVYIFHTKATAAGAVGVYKYSPQGGVLSLNALASNYGVLALGSNGKLYVNTNAGLKISV